VIIRFGLKAISKKSYLTVDESPKVKIKVGIKSFLPRNMIINLKLVKLWDSIVYEKWSRVDLLIDDEYLKCETLVHLAELKSAIPDSWLLRSWKATSLLLEDVIQNVCLSINVW